MRAFTLLLLVTLFLLYGATLRASAGGTGPHIETGSKCEALLKERTDELGLHSLFPLGSKALEKGRFEASQATLELRSLLAFPFIDDNSRQNILDLIALIIGSKNHNFYSKIIMVYLNHSYAGKFLKDMAEISPFDRLDYLKESRGNPIRFIKAGTVGLLNQLFFLEKDGVRKSLNREILLKVAEVLNTSGNKNPTQRNFIDNKAQTEALAQLGPATDPDDFLASVHSTFVILGDSLALSFVSPRPTAGWTPQDIDLDDIFL